MFKIGQEIVCVDDRIGDVDKNKYLKKHKIYVVESLAISGVCLVGVYNGSKYGHPYWHGHTFDRFRPLSDVLAEISLTELMEELVEC